MSDGIDFEPIKEQDDQIDFEEIQFEPAVGSMNSEAPRAKSFLEKAVTGGPMGMPIVDPNIIGLAAGLDTATYLLDKVPDKESILRGAAQGATINFGDEASAAAEMKIAELDSLLKGRISKALQGDVMGAVKGMSDEELEGLKEVYGIKSPLDIVQPAFMAPFTKKDTYQRLRDTYREQNKKAQEANPYLYAGGEIAGGTVATLPAFGYGGAATAGAKTLGQAALQAGKIGAKTGAAFGAATGLGASEADLTEGEIANAAADLALGTGVGAVGGGLIGGAMPVVGAGAKKAVTTTRKYTIDPVVNFFKAKAEDTPFFGAFKYGLRGEKIASKAEVEKNLVPRITKLAEELATSVEQLGDDIAKPATQKINDAYLKTVQDTGRALKLKGDQLTKFVNSALKAQGQIIGDIEQQAAKSGTKVDIRDILSAAQLNLRNIAENTTDTKTLETTNRLINVFTKNMQDEINFSEELVKVFQKASTDPKAAEKLVKSVRKVGGKEVTPEQLKQLLTKYNSARRLPQESAEKVINTPTGVITEKTQRNLIQATKPIEKVSTKFAKDLNKELGSISRDPTLRGELKNSAGAAYYALKERLEDALSSMSDDPVKYLNAKKKFTALKEALEAAGVDDLPIDLDTKEILTPAQFSKMFDKIGKSFTEGDMVTYNRIFDKLAMVDDNIANNFKSDLLEISQKQAQLVKLKTKAPIAQLEGIEEAGTTLSDDLAKAKEQLLDVESLQKQIGGLDPKTRAPVRIGDEETTKLLPGEGVINFLLNQGQGFFEGRKGKSESVKAALNLLKRYNPDVAKKVQTIGGDLAEMGRIANLTARTDSAGAEGALTIRGTTLGGIPALMAKFGNYLGRAAKTIRYNELVQVLEKVPEVGGKYTDVITEAASTGAPALMGVLAGIAAADINAQRALEDVVKNKEISDNFNKLSNKKINAKDLILNFPEIDSYVKDSDMPESVKNLVLESLGKGSDSFTATHYVLMNNFPEYRKFIENLETEVREQIE